MCLCVEGSKLESQPLGKCALRPAGYIVGVLYFNYKYVMMISDGDWRDEYATPNWRPLILCQLCMPLLSCLWRRSFSRMRRNWSRFIFENHLRRTSLLPNTVTIALIGTSTGRHWFVLQPALFMIPITRTMSGVLENVFFGAAIRKKHCPLSTSLWAAMREIDTLSFWERKYCARRVLMRMLSPKSPNAWAGIPMMQEATRLRDMCIIISAWWI